MRLSLLFLSPDSLHMLNTEATTADQIQFSLPGDTEAAHLSSFLTNTTQGLFIMSTENTGPAEVSLHC